MHKPTRHHLSDHGLGDAQTVHIDSCAFNDKELMVLELLRYFCLSYAMPITQGWLSAFKRAESMLGPIEGPMLAYSVSELIAAVRRERTNQFNFVDPRCRDCAMRIYPTELAVMKLVRGAHMDDQESILDAARQIVEGEKWPSTVEAGNALGSCLNCIKLAKRLNSQSSNVTSKYLH